MSEAHVRDGLADDFLALLRELVVTFPFLRGPLVLRHFRSDAEAGVSATQ